jgi:Uncharacterized conserved protein (DUF2304)
MTPRGSFVFDAGACLLALWTLRLVHRDRLYVGYGVMVLLGLAAEVMVASFGRARSALILFTGMTTSLSALGVVAALIATFLAIYVLSQLTVLSNRLTQVVQELAITPLDAAVGHDQLPSDRPVDEG